MRLQKFLMSEEIEEHKEIMSEGIVFFKTSKKLFNLVEKLLKDLERVEDTRQRKSLIEVINKIEKLANRFKNIEDQYSSKEMRAAEKPALKAQYRKLADEYKELLKLLKREDIKKLLGKISKFGLLVLTLAIPLKLMGVVAPAIGVNLADPSWSGLIKKAGIYMGLQLPTQLGGEAITKTMEKAIDSKNKGKDTKESAKIIMRNKDV